MPERKPPRMRAACGQCHSAKVKCSGEKTGCTRCKKLGLRCEYGVSMVGRASKKKSGEREDNGGAQDVLMADASDEDNADTTGSNGLPLLETTPSAFTLPLGGDVEFNFGPQDFMSITGLNDFSFHAFPPTTFDDDNAACNHDHTRDNGPTPPDPSPIPDLSVGGSSTDGSSPPHHLHVLGHSHHHLHPQLQIDPFALPAQHTGMPGTIHQDPSQNYLHPHPQQQQQQQYQTNFNTPPAPTPLAAARPMPPEPLSLSASGSTRTSATDSVEPIFCLARLAYYLERRLRAAEAPLPLDVTLDVIRSSLRELMSLVRLEGTMPSYGCRSLIFACLTLVVKLYSQSYAGYRSAHRPFTGNGTGNGNDGGTDAADDDAAGVATATVGDGAGGNGVFEANRESRNVGDGGGGGGYGAGQQPQRKPSTATAAMKLGQFQVDPEDQIKLQNQIIAAELGRCVQVIKTMAREATKVCPRGGNCHGVKSYECLVSDAQEIKKNIEKESLHDKRMVHPLI